VKVAFKSSFAGDLKKVRDQRLRAAVQEVVEQVEQAENLSRLTNIKKLQGNSNFYRIRIGNYRVGLVVEGETVTFARFLHRKEIYRYFP
jgi:mRNA interferase RelE/StbE